MRSFLKVYVFNVVFICNFMYADIYDESTQYHISKGISTAKQTDLDMLKAADFLAQGKFIDASKVYQSIYDKTRDVYFLKQLAITQSQAGDISKALENAKLYQKLSKDTDDSDINLIIAEDHVRKKEYGFAIILLERIIDNNPTLQIHYILSGLYIQQNELDKALEHLIAIYNDEMVDETKLKLESLNKIISIYMQQNKIDEALRYLDEYISNSSYNIDLENFFMLYSRVNRLDILKESLKKRFLDEKTTDNANLFISILVQLQLYDEAVGFLTKYASILDNDGEELLMYIYADKQEFVKAIQLAEKLYKDTKRIGFLGLSAVYKYETIKNKNENNLQPIIKTLKEVLAQRNKELNKNNQTLTKDDAFFYNFLGYLMIDHNINIDDGMNYVSKALAVEPNSIEYLDSLAWGFYKKGDCKNAKETFNLIPKQKISTIQDLIDHNEAISNCK